MYDTAVFRVSDCDILMLSQFWNITYHDCENNPNYRILAIYRIAANFDGGKF